MLRDLGIGILLDRLEYVLRHFPGLKLMLLVEVFGMSSLYFVFDIQCRRYTRRRCQVQPDCCQGSMYREEAGCNAIEGAIGASTLASR